MDIDTGNDQAGEQAFEGSFDNSMRAVADGIKSKLNANLSMIFNYMNSLKARDPERYAVEVEEYRKIYEDSNTNYSDFNFCFGNGRMEGSQLAIDNMRKILEYTESKLKELYASGNLGQATGGDTGMVVAGDTIDVPSGNGEIAMESVSPVVAMWRGLSPGMRNLVKAGAIAAAIFGTKKLYDVLMERIEKSRLKEEVDIPPEEHEESEEEPEEYEDEYHEPEYSEHEYEE